MICTKCFQAGTIPKCIGEFIIGETDLENGELVKIYFSNTATGVSVDVIGTVEDGLIGTTHFPKLPTDSFIQMWVTLEGAQWNEFQPIKIEGAEYTCIDFKADNATAIVYDLTIVEE